MADEAASTVPDSATTKGARTPARLRLLLGLHHHRHRQRATEENDILLHVFAYADFVLALIAVTFLFAWWKRKPFKDLRKTNDRMAVIGVFLVLATVYAITQETGDPAD